MGTLQHDIEEHAGRLAAYLPIGRAWSAKTDTSSKMWKLLRGFAREFQRTESLLRTIRTDYFPDRTELLLSRWERALGIPDGCFKGTGTVEQRRLAVIVKFGYMNCQTATDFERLADVLGFTVKVRSGMNLEDYPEFPVLTWDSDRERRFTMVVGFDPADLPEALPLELPFLLAPTNIVKCVFDHIRPANVALRYVALLA